SIRSVIDDGEGAVAEVLAKPINDFVVILQMPEGVEKAKADKDDHQDDKDDKDDKASGGW
ncbi:MAG TPA: hypothetical protein VGC42_02175, partial [Kofleriaceae bacterium]